MQTVYLVNCYITVLLSSILHQLEAGLVQIMAEMGVKRGHLALNPPRLRLAQQCCKLLPLSIGCQSACAAMAFADGLDCLQCF